MRSEINKDIRKEIIINDLTMYKLAELLNVSEATLYRKFRKELSKTEKEKILKIIKNFVNE